jgi:aspartyl-tRNA(Asn)/glutamyl-tRNA(Gln) amidotransferase subunit A
MEQMNALSLLALSDFITQVKSGALHASEVWGACSSQIERLNPVLNAFITRLDQVVPDVLHDPTASSLTKEALAGAPIAVKDLFETQGVQTTAGSLFFKGYVPTADAVPVAKVRAAGGLIIGKTNTHEIALGVTTVNPHYGACRNPWDTDRIAGGSSGGSAVAVATGMAIAALGTDTGGSIRIPASLCGVVGLKPTYGRVSLRGVFPLSWNLDHVGPLTRSVADAAIMLKILAGPDEEDPSSAHAPALHALEHLEDGVRGWRVLRASGDYVEDCDPDVMAATQAAAGLFERIGAAVESQDLSFLRQAAVANGLMTQADAAAFHRERLATHPELFGDDVRIRLETGRDTKAGDYVLARRTQAEIRHRLLRLLRKYDVILLPSTPMTAPLIEGADALEQARRLTRFTAPFNLTGLPAISIPCGFSRTKMPIGLQLVTGVWQEARLLQAARAFEREARGDSYRPSLLQ